jgi:hypothetical protein
MAKRAWTLVLAVGLTLATQGCGDDDSGDEGDGDENAGRGGNSGGPSSNAGRGGSSGGSAGGGIDPITDCMVDEMMGGGTTDCDGIEEYTACVQDMCNADDCMDECADYLECAEEADDPCNPSGCTPSGACASCLATVGSCTLANCLELIMCGETASGGACDQLDDCCAEQPEQQRMICEQAASAARTGGDATCQVVLDSPLCM